MTKAALNNALAGSQFLPKYRRHITKTIFSFDDGRLAFTARLHGLPFETVGDHLLDHQYDGLNTFFLTVGKEFASRLSAWFHIDHHKRKPLEKSKLEFGFEWLRDFNQRYLERFEKQDLYENTFYLTFILKGREDDELEETVRELEGIQNTLTKALASYAPQPLGLYEFNGNLFSESYEFFSYLYNGFWDKVPVTSLPMRESIPSGTPHFGYRLMETRFPQGGNRYSMLCDLKAFPETTKKGCFNPLLNLKFPFVLCFSMTFLGISEAIKAVNEASNILESAEDEAEEQNDELSTAKAKLRSGEICFGGFHGALMVHGETEKKTEARVSEICSILNNNCATTFVPATLSAPETFWSLFPGNLKNRPRVMLKTTRNLLSMFSLNAFFEGKEKLNPIKDGSSVIPLKTRSGGVYHFNFHPTPLGVDYRGAKRPGHVLILGTTGAGKTTAQTVLLAHMERFDLDIFAIDKEGSMRGMIEALGGVYYTLKNQVSTGLAPFQFPKTPETMEFLYKLVESCVRLPGEALSSEDENDIKKAVDSVMELGQGLRRFGALLQNIPDRGPNCVARRLAAWCHTETGSGRFAYAFDNPTNQFDIESLRYVGFDVEDFLKKDHPATEPILSTLLFIKSMVMKQGRLMATVIEEFWLPMSFQTTFKQMEDGLRTGRRKSEFLVLVSQLPEDALEGPLAAQILGLVKTKVLLANPDAVYKTKTGGGYHLLISEKEFEILAEFSLTEWKMLIKQKGVHVKSGNLSGESVVAVLDLEGLEEDIAVLAMSKDEFPLLEQAIQAVGKHPDNWVPYYKNLWKTKQLQARSL